MESEPTSSDVPDTPGIVADTGIPDTSAESSDSKRPQFGNRLLRDEEEVYSENAWDHVEWDEDQLEAAKQTVAMQHTNLMPSDHQSQLEQTASQQWHNFYETHKSSFFKDRNWLFTEFPELLIQPDDPTQKRYLLEVGCGAGNTVFPVVHKTSDHVFVYCCDYAPSAVKLVKDNADYDTSRCQAFECDISLDTDAMLSQCPFPPGTIHVISCIFCLSAVPPQRQQMAVNNLARLLAPGGMILFRDYGMYDLTQLRFKQTSERAISSVDNNYYARGDGTFVSYFTQEHIERLFVKEAGLKQVQSIVDNRLIVNRAKKTKMYRVWLQAKYQKPLAVVEGC